MKWAGLNTSQLCSGAKITRYTVGSIAILASTRGNIHRLGRRFWGFERIGMRILQQGNSPYSCLFLRRIREVA